MSADEISDSSQTVAAGILRAFVERVERIEADIADLNSDKSEIYKELRGQGFDVKTVRKIVAKRKIDEADREEQDALFELYWEALTGASRVHVHEAGPVSTFGAKVSKALRGEAANFVSTPHDSETGEIIDTPETAQPNPHGTASDAVDPSTDHVSPPARTRTSGSGSANTGECHVNPRELPTYVENTSLAAREGEEAAAPNSEPDLAPPADRQAEADASPAPSTSASATHFQFKPHVLRPNCQRPENCGGYGSKHCGSCERAGREVAAA